MNIPCGHVFCEKCIVQHSQPCQNEVGKVEFNCIKHKQLFRFSLSSLSVCFQILANIPDVDEKPKESPLINSIKDVDCFLFTEKSSYNFGKPYSELNKVVISKDLNSSKGHSNNEAEVKYYCKRHSKNEVTHYCKIHNLMICYKCRDEHLSDCDIVSFDNHFFINHNLSNLQATIKDFDSKVLDETSALDSKIQFINNYYEKQLININNQIDLLIDQILEKKLQLLDTVRISHSEQNKSLIKLNEKLKEKQIRISSFKCKYLTLEEHYSCRSVEDYFNMFLHLKAELLEFREYTESTKKIQRSDSSVSEYPFAYFVLNSKIEDIGIIKYFMSMNEVQTKYREMDDLFTTKQNFFSNTKCRESLLDSKERSQTPIPRNRNAKSNSNNLQAGTTNTMSNINSSKEIINQTNITNNTNIFNVSSNSFNKNDNSRLSNNVFKDNMLSYHNRKSKKEVSADISSNIIYKNNSMSHRSNASSKINLKLLQGQMMRENNCDKGALDLNSAAPSESPFINLDDLKNTSRFSNILMASETQIAKPLILELRPLEQDKIGRNAISTIDNNNLQLQSLKSIKKQNSQKSLRKEEFLENHTEKTYNNDLAVSNALVNQSKDVIISDNDGNDERHVLKNKILPNFYNKGKIVSKRNLPSNPTTHREGTTTVDGVGIKNFSLNIPFLTKRNIISSLNTNSQQNNIAISSVTGSQNSKHMNYYLLSKKT